jgi:RNA polymerase sigma factor (sigma-70 family)
MPGTPVPGVLRQLRRALHTGSGATDGQLLERFRSQRDEDAFELLVWRHERLVLSVCRRILNDPQDAEDAFQATFLTLVRKAGAIGRGQALASWLYQVACRIALRARAGLARRAGRERRGLDLSGLPAALGGTAEQRELGPLLDEEISRLPEKYRVPVVLCYLEGQTYDQAARRLGCPVGTLATRLAHAREQLRTRLARRGVGLGAGSLAAILCERAAAAAPGALVSATVKAAASVAAGRAAAGAVAPQVAAMMEGALRAMMLTKLRIAAALLLAVGLLGGGVTLLAPGGPAARAAGQAKEQTPGEGGEAGEAQTDKDGLQGTWLVVGVEEGGGKVPEQALKEAKETFVVKGETMTYCRDGKVQVTMIIRLNLRATPTAVDLEFTDGKEKGYKNHAIYRLDGDTLRLRMNDKFGGNSANERPTNFSTAEGKEAVLFILKRVKGGETRPAKEAPPRAKAEAPKTDKERLQGTWVGVSINAKGEGVPAEQARAYRITFAGDRVKPQRPLEAAEDYPYRIDPMQKPKTIDFLARRAGLGVYEFAGDKLRLCLTDEDAPRPTDFKPGERRVVIVLKRAGTPTKAEAVADLKLLVKALRDALARLRESNAFLKEELLKRSEESERRKDEIGGVLTKVDVGNNTVSLTLGRTKLALNGVPLSVRSKFFLGLRECTINDLKPGMEITLRLEDNGDRSEVVRIDAAPAGKQ